MQKISVKAYSIAEMEYGDFFEHFDGWTFQQFRENPDTLHNWLGITTVLSLGEWSDFYPLGFIPALAEETIFDVFEWLAANILLLIGATATSIFFGWLVPKDIKLEGLGISDGKLLAYVNAMMRFVIPPVLIVALVLGLLER